MTILSSVMTAGFIVIAFAGLLDDHKNVEVLQKRADYEVLNVTNVSKDIVKLDIGVLKNRNICLYKDVLKNNGSSTYRFQIKGNNATKDKRNYTGYVSEQDLTQLPIENVANPLQFLVPQWIADFSREHRNARFRIVTVFSTCKAANPIFVRSRWFSLR